MRSGRTSEDRRRVVEVERRGDYSIADRKYRKDCLDAPGRTEQMPNCRFRRGHRKLVGVPAKKPFHRAEFDFIAKRGGGAVRVDVIDFLGSETGAPQRVAHRPEGTVAVLGRGGEVEGITRHAIP